MGGEVDVFLDGTNFNIKFSSIKDNTLNMKDTEILKWKNL